MKGFTVIKNIKGKNKTTSGHTLVSLLPHTDSNHFPCHTVSDISVRPKEFKGIWKPYLFWALLSQKF